MRNHLIVILVLLLAVSSWAQSAKPYYSPDQEKGISIPDSLRISYIGNMGVLIESGEQTLIIDGLHEEYKPDYAYPPEEMVKKLIEGAYQNFSKIEMALSTHMHGDHFSAAYAKAFLKENPRSLVIGSDQIRERIEKIEGGLEADLKGAVKVIEYDGQVHQINQNNVKVKAVRCDHVNPSRHRSIQNIAYLVEINGYSILHIGDTNWDLVEKPFIALQLREAGPDLAIIPYWMLYGKGAKEKIAELINPEITIATHIPPHFSESEQQGLLKNHPNLILFTELGAAAGYKKAGR